MIDYAKTVGILDVDPCLIVFMQEGLIEDSAAYASPLVGQLRLFFLVKACAFQVFLVALPYSPRIQILLILAFELTYLIVPIVKHAAVKIFKSPVFIIHLVGQTTLLIAFLALVMGMTFKGYKYGNGSTISDYDASQWSYGQNMGIFIVSTAVIAEFLVFVLSGLLMVRGLVQVIIRAILTPKTSSDVEKEKLKKEFVSYKLGMFFKFFDQNEPLVVKKKNEFELSKSAGGGNLAVAYENGRANSKRLVRQSKKSEAQEAKSKLSKKGGSGKKGLEEHASQVPNEDSLPGKSRGRAVSVSLKKSAHSRKNRLSVKA